MMDILEVMLKDIKDTQENIQQVEKLIDALAASDDSVRCASISCNGSWVVKFQAHEVINLLVNRLSGLQVKEQRLLEAKDAAEKTAQGWLRFGRDV